MKVVKLNLTNFRDAQALSLELNPKLNVFVGVNGSGKSTVLDAIAIMLSWPASRIIRPGASGRPITENDITNGKSSSSIKLSSEIDSKTIEWKLAKNRKGHAASEDKSNLHDLKDYVTAIQKQISETSEKVNIPLFVYYPVNRAVLDIPLRIRGQHSFDLLTAYDNALTTGANFRTFFEWFRVREDLENEMYREFQDFETFFERIKKINDFERGYSREYPNVPIKPTDSQFLDPQLEAVRNALSKILPDFSNITVRRSPLRMEVEKNGKRLTVNQLSGGELNLIAMIGDLARRMAIANPDSTKPLEGSGIVLIDEIDLHLHPKWQRMIVPKLLDVFPNCQFIISTHSPHVITHVQPECLFLLKQTDLGIVVDKPNESYGKNVDRVLEDLMGLKTTRPEEVASELDSIFKTIDTGNKEDAQKKIAKLKLKIGADPELVKAEVLMKRRELIGK
ncbi:MAG: AAA family ATPase [ANME-2 cluster archaeon]|nr:AAA family ATPase [ANME-2 cluster archaeon]MBC2701238.1 AAA family ATPase [ANME-2 cluster archaeon]MBC2708912.1 AAA family ATPase [ANME-2 cluster archaeon]MBC2746770.1 AAA family ATPase [ANME-2 cluster archaeon]MBC2762955.1 AAA family ATPase [ANME-2 cluster archaeon]